MKTKLVLMLLCMFVASCAAAEKSAVVKTSFEEFKQGGFTELKTEYGTWKAQEGNAAIDGHNRNGRNCLHIVGGEDKVLEFIPKAAIGKDCQLSFWAERWTSRGPFKFRIEAFASGKWSEIYNGDSKVKVGRSFLTHVAVGPLDSTIEKFRFTCTSPEKSGVLIDDLSLIKPAKMKLIAIETAQQVSPVVIGKDSDILQINVKVDGNLEPLAVTSLGINTAGTGKLSDIEDVKAYYTGNKGGFSSAKQFGRAKKAANKLTFTDKVQLVGGDNYFWVSCNLKTTADLLRKIDAGCDYVTVGTQNVKPEVASPEATKRIAIALRDSGDDGSKGYRIPGLATTNKGTLIGVYDVRYNGMGDLPGHIDVGMSRSSDKGQTWEPMQVIMDMGEPHGQNGIGDPAVLVDRGTNTIWVAAVWSHGNRGWHGSRPGMTPEDTGQFVLVKSEDDGRTWSKPINITEQIKDPKWYYLLQGPGKGITLRDGTLVFPAQFKDENNMPHSTLVYSKDHGKTWTIGTGAKSNTTEAQIVELNDGRLMLNMRDNRGGSRSVYVTDDLGKTWTEHPTTRSALPEPVCMASLIRFASTKDGDNRDVLLFSNPATKSGRTHINIKASTDEGMTWPEKYHKLIHEPACAGYSCMTKIDDKTVGILYEGGNTALLVFEKFDISEIIQN